MEAHKESLQELHTHALSNLSSQELQDPSLEPTEPLTHSFSAEKEDAPAKQRTWWGGHQKASNRPEGRAPLARPPHATS